MKPSELTSGSFAGYEPEARALAVEHLAVLQGMPLPLLPNYLQQIRGYATLFPVEQTALGRQLDALQRQPGLVDAFRAIELTPAVAELDWLGRPEVFLAALAGSLWQTQQIDQYHRAAESLFNALPKNERSAGSPAPLLIAVLGRGTSKGSYPLFTRLRAQGLYARSVEADRAPELFCALLGKRAASHPEAYAHWYVDGGEPWPLSESAGVQRFTFPQLAPVTDAVLREMDRAVREGWGPEVLAVRLREMRPSALGLRMAAPDPRMDHFFLSLLTEGSGTQLYSTSFVQTAGVELARRAQPTTLLLRFAPRRRPASMNDMLEQHGQSAETDPQGALVDADMGLYYAWLALQRQPGGDQARLLAYVEGHGEAFLVGPSVTRGVESESPLALARLLEMV